MDTTHYTISSDAVAVPVAEFRNATDALSRVCRVDYHACVGASEKAQWVARARRVAARLIGMTCKRARCEDWNRRESAIDRATTLVLAEHS